jgi:hypothetical protein
LAIYTKQWLTRNRQATTAEVLEEALASVLLAKQAAAFDPLKLYDIFLSHAYADALLIRLVRDDLVRLGWSVYVDWIDDPALDRKNVTAATARQIKDRMSACKVLFYAVTENSPSSVWMPWELGYFDGAKDRVAILPILDRDQSQYDGQQYLGIYPYVDHTETAIWIHRDAGSYVRLEDFIAGKKP